MFHPEDTFLVSSVGTRMTMLGVNHTHKGSFTQLSFPIIVQHIKNIQCYIQIQNSVGFYVLDSMHFWIQYNLLFKFGF